MIEAASKVTDVSSIKGLGRFFKQIAESTKGSDAQDDFLGCVTIPLKVCDRASLQKFVIRFLVDLDAFLDRTKVPKPDRGGSMNDSDGSLTKTGADVSLSSRRFPDRG